MTGSTVMAAASIADERYLQVLLINEAGIDIGERRGSLLAARLSPVAERFGLGDVASIVRALRLGNDALTRDVVAAMTTNETSWFRDRHVFDGLVSTVVPPLLKRLAPDESLTIWSAASSSGQEVYSLAILLAESFPGLVQQKRVRLLATDLNPAMVERCREGRYSDLEMRRGMKEEYLETYFNRTADGWVVSQRLRSMVLSRVLNLADSLGPVPRCDLVLLRNVLIYFSAELKTSILREVNRAVLKSQGALVLGGAEMIGDAKDIYDMHNGPAAVYFTPRSAP